VNNIFLT